MSTKSPKAKSRSSAGIVVAPRKKSKEQLAAELIAHKAKIAEEEAEKLKHLIVEPPLRDGSLHQRARYYPPKSHAFPPPPEPEEPEEDEGPTEPVPEAVSTGRRRSGLPSEMFDNLDRNTSHDVSRAPSKRPPGEESSTAAEPGKKSATVGLPPIDVEDEDANPVPEVLRPTVIVEGGTEAGTPRNQRRSLKKQGLPRPSFAGKIVSMELLPDVFCVGHDVSRRSDSPFSTALPVPRKHALSDVLRECDELHEEGIRKTRLLIPDYKAARRLMESAWEMMEDKLAEEAEFIESIRKPPPEEEKPAEDGNEEKSNAEVRTQAEKQRHRVAQHKLQHAAHVENEITYKKSMGTDLTLVYTRLEEWEKVDTTTALVLSFSGAPKRSGSPRRGSTKIADEKTDRDEERWAQLMIRRAVACAHRGPEHIGRAEEYLAEVLTACPRHRDAKQGQRCVRFLRSQMVTEGAHPSYQIV